MPTLRRGETAICDIWEGGPYPSNCQLFLYIDIAPLFLNASKLCTPSQFPFESTAIITPECLGDLTPLAMKSTCESAPAQGRQQVRPDHGRASEDRRVGNFRTAAYGRIRRVICRRRIAHAVIRSNPASVMVLHLPRTGTAVEIISARFACASSLRPKTESRLAVFSAGWPNRLATK